MWTFRLFNFFEFFDFSTFRFFRIFDFSSRNLLECELFNFSGETFLPRLEFSATSRVWTTQTIDQTGYARVPVLSSILHQKASEVQVLWVGKMPSQKPTKIVADDILRYYILLCYIIYFFILYRIRYYFLIYYVTCYLLLYYSITLFFKLY